MELPTVKAFHKRVWRRSIEVAVATVIGILLVTTMAATRFSVTRERLRTALVPEVELLPHEELLRRLQGQTIHFIGDSITRYQYNELVHFLETGMVSDMANSTTLIQGRFDPVNEKTWESWSHFFRGTTENYTKGIATIDAWRESTQRSELIENRYYRNGNLELSYYQYYTDLGICSLKGKATWDVPATTPDPEWCFKLPAFVRNIVETAKFTRRGTTILLNSGWHEPYITKVLFDEVYAIFAELEDDHEIVPQTAPLLIWKGTTPAMETDGPTDEQLDLSSRHASNFQILDTRAIYASRFRERARTSLYWDNLHFIAEVYHVFNEVLADMVTSRHHWVTAHGAMVAPIQPLRGRGKKAHTRPALDERNVDFGGPSMQSFLETRGRIGRHIKVNADEDPGKEGAMPPLIDVGIVSEARGR
ncbi:hypothetical protein HDU89_003698 [Geranomyces variabilis]|nr:hypothetical protein HDU89_003698 [Geranomyces variabilis]